MKADLFGEMALNGKRRKNSIVEDITKMGR
jgi:hypothetical protein